MILVCGGLADSVTELVCARLDDCGYAYRLLNLGTYPAEFQIKWNWQGEHPRGYIANSDWRVELDDLTGVYVRYLGPEGRAPVSGVEPEQATAIYAECDSGLIALLEFLPCAVVNRSAGAMSNHSKPYQAILISECGLLVPPTLVTSDPDEARRFYDECNGEVIYKSLSGVRSIVRRVGAEHLERLPLLQHGPAQFQKFIPGENVRVHTVGDEVFPTIVHSEAVDYRYGRREGHTVEMEPATLPKAVSDACLRLAGRLDLLFTGIDLKLTPSGEYYCFEVNPSPGFIFYEQHSGQPISAALADLLLKGPASAHPGAKGCAINAAGSPA
jgi:hypothetical protein